jgi:hypothetical protein
MLQSEARKEKNVRNRKFGILVKKREHEGCLLDIILQYLTEPLTLSHYYSPGFVVDHPTQPHVAQELVRAKVAWRLLMTNQIAHSCCCQDSRDQATATTVSRNLRAANDEGALMRLRNRCEQLRAIVVLRGVVGPALAAPRLQRKRMHDRVWILFVVYLTAFLNIVYRQPLHAQMVVASMMRATEFELIILTCAVGSRGLNWTSVEMPVQLGNVNATPSVALPSILHQMVLAAA